MPLPSPDPAPSPEKVNLADKQGAFDMQFRDKTVRVGEGEFLDVPR